MKQESETRWSARAGAVEVVYKKYFELVNVLKEINEPDAFVVLNDISNYYFCLLLPFWHHLLQDINRVQLRLHDPSINFRDATSDRSGLKDVLHQERNCNASFGTEEMVIEGKEFVEKMELDEPRLCQKKMMSGEVIRDSGLTATKNLKGKMKACIDRFLSEFNRRFCRLNDLDKKFGFLLDVKITFLIGTAPVWVKEKCDYFADQYSELDGNNLRFEITDVISLIKVRSNVFVSSPLDLLKFITEYGNDTFPNLRLALQLMLTICTSTASCERSLSRLKLILKHLRSTMTHQPLCHLAQISIERSTAQKIDFTKILKEFSM